jgi:hypothetical protein
MCEVAKPKGGSFRSNSQQNIRAEIIIARADRNNPEKIGRLASDNEKVTCITNLDDPKPLCGLRYFNGFQYLRQQEAEAQRAQDRRQAQQRSADNARQQVELQNQQRKQAAAAKAQRVADRYRADGWIPWSKVNANQFAYDGKVLMVLTTFERMLTSDTAQFGDPLFAQPVVALGVPRTTFTEQRHLILVGRLTTSSDERSSQSAGMGIPVIRMRYIGHEFCSETKCTDFTGEPARN